EANLALSNRFNVMMLHRVRRRFDETLVETSIIDRRACSRGLADKGRVTINGPTSATDELINRPNLAIILEPGADNMKPSLATITVNPRHLALVFGLDRNPDQVTS